MSSVLDSRVLVLSKSWLPIDTTSVFDAINKVLGERAKIVGPDYDLYGLDEWIESWQDAKKVAKLAEEKVISAVNFQMAVPEVIITSRYNGFFMRKAKLSRSAIFARDDYICQYCGESFKKSDMNIDHVVPRAQGGSTTWTNLVLACIPCNSKKGNRTPDQAGMKLRREPFQPHWSMVKHKRTYKQIPKSWEEFLGKIYWDTTLKD